MKTKLSAMVVLSAIVTTLAICTGYLAYSYNELAKECAERTKIMGASDDCLHYFYKNNKDSWDKFIKTNEYQTLDSLKSHDWEDFFYY